MSRRGQVLVLPWVRSGAVGATVFAFVLAAGLSWSWKPRPASIYPQLPPPPPMPVRLYVPKAPTPRLWSRGSLFAPRPGVLDATVLAHTLSLGAAGPRIPIALGFSRDGAAIPEQALGSGVAVGETRSVAVPRGSVALVTAARYASYGALEDNVYVRSDLPGSFADCPEPRARLLVNGDAVPHPRRIGYGGQPSLAQILAPRLGAGGRLVLPPNQAIVAYEYTSHFFHPAADFQDLVVLLTYTPEK